MKTTMKIILSLLLVLSFSGSTFAAGCIGSDLGTAKGHISSIDLNTQTITIKEEMGKAEVDRTYGFNNDTNFVKGNELKSLADIKVGDKVTIIYKSQNNNSLAKTITVESEK